MAKITKESRTVIIALLLGSGEIANSTLILKNDDAQYLEYIKFILKKHGINTTNVIDFHNLNPKDFTNSKVEDFATNEEEYEQISNRDFSKLPRFGLRTYKHKFMGVFKCMTYGGKMRRKWFKRFNPIHLAILYMEIGSLTRENGKLQLILNTNTTQEDNQVVIDWLAEDWSLVFHEKRIEDDKYVIYCGFYTAHRFCKIIAKYVHPNMSYKLVEND